MNYIYPTKELFRIPSGEVLKRKTCSDDLRSQRDILRKCVNMKDLVKGKRVYNFEVIDESSN